MRPLRIRMMQNGQILQRSFEQPDDEAG